jgi:hypothetical protein
MIKSNQYIKPLLFMSVASLLSIQTAVAAPITVTEGTDFSDVIGFEANVGTLGVGTNVISGFLAAAGDSGDDFIFSMPTNGHITNVTVSISNFTGVPGTAASGFAVIYEPGNTPPNFDNNIFPGDGAFNLTLPDPNKSEYEVNFETQPTLFTASYNWSVAIDVAPVPVPVAAWLFGSGLLGLIGFARKKSV